MSWLTGSASRGVDLANGKNPIGIIVACHRVVGSTGDLTDYGGGLTRKQFLLDFERKVSATSNWVIDPLGQVIDVRR